MTTEAMSLLEDENQLLKKMLHRIDAEKSAAIIHSAQMAERVDELEGVIRQLEETINRLSVEGQDAVEM